MIFTKLYTRKISVLSEIEQENIFKTIRYDLCTSELDNNGNIYGIRIKSYLNSKITQSILYDISINKNFVEQIIKYLWDNSIDEVCFKDIVHDLLFELETKGRKYC